MLLTSYMEIKMLTMAFATRRFNLWAGLFQLFHLLRGVVADAIPALLAIGFIAWDKFQSLFRVCQGQVFLSGSEVSVGKAVIGVRRSGICSDVQLENLDCVDSVAELDVLVAD